MSRTRDVIVVGGGVIGCAVAYELARRKVDVLLVDKSLPGRATSASAGGLWPVGEAIGLGCGVIYHSAHSNGQGSPEPLPEAFRNFLTASNACFPVLAQELLELTQVDIEYEAGAGLLFVIYTEAEKAFVERVHQSLAPEARFDMLDAPDVARLEPRLTRALLGGALLPGEHQVNPMLLAEGFKRGAVCQGAAFRHDTRVTGLRRRGDRVTGVEIGDEFLPCATVINAAGAWAGPLAASAALELPVTPVRGQIVLTETLPQTLKLCLSTSSCYLAQKAHGEILIGSTTEKTGYDTSVTLTAIRTLCHGAIRAIPMLESAGIKRTWAGLRPGTPDELPILGPAAGVAGYLNAAGGFRTGIVAAPLTGRVVAQLVAGEAPSCPLEAFSVDRFAPAERRLTPSSPVRA